MTPDALTAWRARCGLSQRAAADALGLSVRALRYYEAGERFIPRPVALACAAVETGLEPIA
jgi:transcriptional regulator with XRE-family HTH domain